MGKEKGKYLLFLMILRHRIVLYHHSLYIIYHLLYDTSRDEGYVMYCRQKNMHRRTETLHSDQRESHYNDYSGPHYIELK